MYISECYSWVVNTFAFYHDQHCCCHHHHNYSYCWSWWWWRVSSCFSFTSTEESAISLTSRTKVLQTVVLFPDIIVLHTIMCITVYQSMSQTAGTMYFVPLCPMLCCLLHCLLPHHLCLHNIVSLLRYNCDTLNVLWCFDHNERCHQVERISDLTTSP